MTEQIGYEPGWTGAFTREQAPGAQIPNGTRIVKTRSEPNDRTPNGATGTVLGSLPDPPMGTLYFVEWDDRPRMAVAVIDWKIGRSQ